MHTALKYMYTYLPQLNLSGVVATIIETFLPALVPYYRIQSNLAPLITDLGWRIVKARK